MSHYRDPRSVQLRLEQTLAQWRQWRCQPSLPGAPHLLGPLPGGLSNHNFLVRATTQSFVVRIDGINPARHWLNRQVEWLVLQSASQAGLAPTPRYFNPELGALVVDYCEADPAREIAVEDLAALAGKVHSLPRRHHRVDLEERIRGYRHRLQREGKPAPSPELEKRLDIILEQLRQESSSTPVLTHNDLMPANLLYSGGRLLALDWEYCGMGSHWFDLAVISLGAALDETGQSTLLRHYLGESPARTQSGLLRQYRAIARYIELLWHLAESAPEEASDLLEKWIPLLEDELP